MSSQQKLNLGNALKNIQRAFKELLNQKDPIATKTIKVTQIGRYYYPFCGGIEAVSKQISDVLTEDAFKVEAIACDDGSNTSKKTIDNVFVKRCGTLFEFKSNNISFNFMKELSKVDTDVLHYHMPYIFSVIAHFITKPKFKKLSITYHSDIVGYDLIMKFLGPIYNEFLKQVDSIHVLSPNIIKKSPILQKFRDKCEVIPYAIDTNNFLEKENTAKTKELKSRFPDKKILLFVGRLIPYKGITYLIDAMKQVEDNAVLLIIGSGELKDELEAKVKQNNLENKIFFEGRVSDEDLLSYYKACDIFTFPSIMPSEAFGISQVEAMINSKPVINTRLGTGVNYVSIHNETGLTVEPKNTKQLADAVNLLVKDDELRNKLGKNAKKRAEEMFTFENVKKQYLLFFKDK